jgi:hypothetical protein
LNSHSGALVLLHELLEGLGPARIAALLSLAQLTALNELLFMHATSVAPLHATNSSDGTTTNNHLGATEKSELDRSGQASDHALTRALAHDALATLQETMEAMVALAAEGGGGGGGGGERGHADARAGPTRGARIRIERLVKFL